MSRQVLSFIFAIFASSIILQGCGQKNQESVAPVGLDARQNIMTILPQGDWKLDPTESALIWSAQKIVGGHTGTIKVAEGNLNVNADSTIDGQFTVDMTSIADADNSEKLIAHLKGDDFFAVENYPEATFVFTNVDELEENSDGIFYNVTGDLTIRGITHSIDFKAHAVPQDKKLDVKASFMIDRTRWGIVFNSGSFFQNLGDKAIDDLINFELDLVFNLL